jgi:hypothetical protein
MSDLRVKERIVMKKHFPLLVALVMSFGAFFGFAGAAHADTTVTSSSSCTNTTDPNGVTVNNCAVEGAAQFSVNESFSNSGALQLVTRGHAYLTFQTHPMTKSQITGKCTFLPLGTPFWNGFKDTKTGKTHYKKWHVTSGPGENKFCPGKDHKLHKFNCNNPVKGVPFHTAPPPKKKRIKAHAFTGDYLTWVANLELTASKHVGGTISIHNPDSTCNMVLYLDNDVRASNMVAVTVRARNVAKARSAAVSSVKEKASSNEKVQSSLQQNISLYINNQVKGVCTSSSSTPPPPPPVQHWTQISCMGFEEITVGGSLKVSCVVSDDNGAPVSLSANSLDTNTKVSGIKCKDNGTASCPSGGTFEFTVVGVHEGTSQVQAIASANGVTATFTSDPFPVDPEDGGF